ncbi:MAG: hypothetical protein ACOC5T_02410 [Elusimicrobiota bacterium]
MGTNYQKGRAKEYRVIRKLEDQGFDIAQRSAGSHSPVDIWAVDTDRKKILLVQAKPSDFSLKKEKELLEKHKDLNGKFDVEFDVR